MPETPWIANSEQIEPTEQATTRTTVAGETVAKFSNREEIERLIVFGLARTVPLEGVWKGKREVVQYKMMMDDMMAVSEQIAFIMAELFPHDLFFLYSVNLDNVATAAAKIHQIVFDRVQEPVAEIIYRTCRISNEERGQFRRSITVQDFMELFVNVIEELNNDVIKAIIRKLQRLLGEKFSLANAFPNIFEFTEETLENFAQQLRMNSSSS